MLFNVFRDEFDYPERLDTVDHQMGPAFFIDVGNACNFKCLFCSVDRTIAYEDPESLAEYVAEAGRHHLGVGMFTGGEPSLYPHLERVMEHGLAHGVEAYGMSTNAWGLRDPARVARLVDLRMNTWSLSLDDHRPEMADHLRGHSGVLERIVETMALLDTYPESKVNVYHVLVKQNFRHLPDMIRFVASLRDKHPSIWGMVTALVKPVEHALVNDEVLFDYSEALDSFMEGIRVADELEFPFVFNNMPGCLVPDALVYHCSPWEHLAIVDTSTGRTHRMWFGDYPLVKGPRCLECRMFERCNGYFDLYRRRFGDEVFTPSGELLRDEPLAPRILEEERAELAEFQARRNEEEQQHGGDAPPVRANELYIRGAEADMLERVAPLFDAAIVPPWTLGAIRLDQYPCPTSIGLELHLEGADEPLLVIVAPLDETKRAYKKTERLMVWYQGGDLSAPQRGVLDAILSHLPSIEAAFLSLFEP